jgi:hypothetical protein
VAAHRLRARAEETESAEWWLRTHLKEQTPGDRVAAPVLWTSCRTDLSALVAGDASDPEVWADFVEEDGAPALLRPPSGRRVFYAEADRLYGPRTLGHAKTHFYTYPEVPLPDRDAFSEAILDRVARLAWEEQRYFLLDFMARRDVAAASHAATGTDGNVVEIASRRRS